MNRTLARRRQRLAMIVAGVAMLGAALGLVLFALRDTIVFFRSPSEIAALNIAPGTRLRLGGLVKEGSVVRPGGQRVDFVVTDGARDIPVSYSGLLPDLFREGQGVVAEGVLAPGGGFAADSVLARHDENYMPREVAETLRDQGLWRHADRDGDVPAPAPAR